MSTFSYVRQTEACTVSEEYEKVERKAYRARKEKGERKTTLSRQGVDRKGDACPSSEIGIWKRWRRKEGERHCRPA